MSSVSGIDTSQSLLMQQILAQQNAKLTGATQQPPPEVEAKIESAAQAAGLDPTAIANLRQKIETAVQSAKDNNVGRDALKATIDNILKAVGVDVSSLSGKLTAINGPSGGQYAGKLGANPPQNLSELLGDSENDNDQDDGSAFSLLGQLQKLPAGSLYDLSA